MAFTREVLLDLVQKFGGGDFNKIFRLVTTNSDTILMSGFQTPGNGVRWVDEDLGNGNYRTGVELYHSAPPSTEHNLEENGTKIITFIEVEAIDRLSFKTDGAPAWAWKPPTTP